MSKLDSQRASRAKVGQCERSGAVQERVGPCDVVVRRTTVVCALDRRQKLVRPPLDQGGLECGGEWASWVALPLCVLYVLTKCLSLSAMQRPVSAHFDAACEIEDLDVIGCAAVDDADLMWGEEVKDVVLRRYPHVLARRRHFGVLGAFSGVLVPQAGELVAQVGTSRTAKDATGRARAVIDQDAQRDTQHLRRRVHRRQIIGLTRLGAPLRSPLFATELHRTTTHAPCPNGTETEQREC